MVITLLKDLNMDEKKLGLNQKNHIVSFSCLLLNFFQCFFTFSPRIVYFISNQNSLVFSLQSLAKIVFSKEFVYAFIVKYNLWRLLYIIGPPMRATHFYLHNIYGLGILGIVFLVIYLHLVFPCKGLN